MHGVALNSLVPLRAMHGVALNSLVPLRVLHGVALNLYLFAFYFMIINLLTFALHFTQSWGFLYIALTIYTYH
jgi:hypothetical protein